MSDWFQAYDKGLANERRIACWLREFGYTVLHIKSEDKFALKGPRLLLPARELVCPDLLCVAGPGELAGICWAPPFWIEAKGKEGFTYTLSQSAWEWGIERPIYREYLRVEKQNPWPILIMTPSEGKVTKRAPGPSDRGLFMRPLEQLEAAEHREYDGPAEGDPSSYGRGGMVYWNAKEFWRIASYEALLAAEKLFDEVSDGTRSKQTA